MGLKEMIEKLRGIETPDEDIDDNETKDRYLRSLRREKRTQDEEVEKERLKIEIAEFKKARMRKHLFGIKEGLKEKVKLKHQKQKELLKDGNNILSGKKAKPRQQSYFGRHNI